MVRKPEFEESSQTKALDQEVLVEILLEIVRDFEEFRALDRTKQEEIEHFILERIEKEKIPILSLLWCVRDDLRALFELALKSTLEPLERGK